MLFGDVEIGRTMLAASAAEMSKAVGIPWPNFALGLSARRHSAPRISLGSELKRRGPMTSVARSRQTGDHSSGMPALRRPTK
jgi:hypothetical protein